MGLRNKKDREEHTIDVDAAMQGSLVFKDPVNLKINGKFEGRLEVKGNLTISDTAFVDAHIKCENISISGRVKGDIESDSRIELLNHAVVEGNIKTPRLVISDGAIFQGTCIMMHDILNADDLAKHLELDHDTIVQWANSGKIPGFKEGEEWKFERKRIDDWIAAGKIG
ncbi:MAG: polymer-forming cytoskeletal protein [Candidatus Omnitrophica bacterium]|nr:polymer-forming cytoskeletal protein [Candidatus Omnitrophota bacterium]MDD5352577.1 polymer-forming cytoskeletal protein [Candidatus Omnitrophota bacterium]MDD5550175.1 polymer-forming cytoskeletal protein [Candidatus Omnitrophota bacterium]